MSSNQEIPIKEESIIQVIDAGKCYKIYENPKDRLKQALRRGSKQYYKEFWALRNVNIDIRRGDSLGIIGRNGSGKSTLLQLICGTLTPTEGSVKTRGQIAALLELGSGFNPEFTGIENVHLNASLLGLTRKETEEKLEDILAFADIGEFVHQPVRTYSSGMVVRLAFSVIANANPSILIVDEALAVGDAIFTRKCMRFIDGLRKEKTILFVSHDAASVASLCDQCLWIDKGSVVMNANTRNVIESYRKACHADFQDTDFSTYTTVEADQVNLSSSTSAFAIAPTAVVSAAQPIEHPSVTSKNGSFTHGIAKELKPLVVSFKHSAQQFGDGAVLIEKFSLIYKEKPNESVEIVNGGEKVILKIQARCLHTIARACIAGFSISNEQGLEFFGENTFIPENPLAGPVLQKEEIILAQFCFTIPPLKPGTYFVTVALASGTQLDHVQHHYIHEAIQFVSTANLERPIMGMFATDIEDISINKQSP